MDCFSYDKILETDGLFINTLANEGQLRTLLEIIVNAGVVYVLGLEKTYLTLPYSSIGEFKIMQNFMGGEYYHYARLVAESYEREDQEKVSDLLNEVFNNNDIVHKGFMEAIVTTVEPLYHIYTLQDAEPDIDRYVNDSTIVVAKAVRKIYLSMFEECSISEGVEMEILSLRNAACVYFPGRGCDRLKYADLVSLEGNELIEMMKFIVSFDRTIDVFVDSEGDNDYTEGGNVSVKKENKAIFISHMSVSDQLYEYAEDRQKDTKVGDLLEYDLNDYDPKYPLTKIELNMLNQKKVRYDIKTTQLEPREEYIIKLRQLFQRDYSESLYQLESMLFSKTDEELRVMLETLS